MMKRRDYLQAAAAGLLTMAGAGQLARAQNAKAIPRVVVGFSPGGTGDVIARALAESIRKAGAGMVLVDNRPGVGGRLAVQAVKGASPDGSALLLSPGWVLTLTRHTDRHPTFDAFTDLIPIGAFSVQDYAIAVGPTMPARNLAEFVAYVKARPGSGQYASAGVGSMAHLVGSMIEKSAGVPFLGIPYKGASQSLQDMQAGHVLSNIGALGDMARMHREGSARVLATTGTKRSKFLPDVPTFEEAGLSGVRAVDWTGLFAPAKTPPDVIASYSRLLQEATKDRDFIAVVERLGSEVSYLGPADLASRMKADSDAMRDHVKSFGLKDST